MASLGGLHRLVNSDTRGDIRLPDLAAWIDVYWMVSWNLPKPYLQETLPHPNLYLVFENGKSVIGGVSTRKFSRVLSGNSGVFGVKFKPGGFRPFMKSAARSLQNQTVPAKDIFGSEIDALDKIWGSVRLGGRQDDRDGQHLFP